MFDIIKYSDQYEDELMKLIEDEGEDWAVYWEEPNASRYRKSFAQCLTYLAIEDGKVVPDLPLYVMSGNDEYYDKIGFITIWIKTTYYVKYVLNFTI